MEPRKAPNLKHRHPSESPLDRCPVCCKVRKRGEWIAGQYDGKVYCSVVCREVARVPKVKTPQVPW